MGAGDHLDQRRLARAVFADQGVDFAGPQVERDPLQGLHAGKRLADPGQLEQRRQDPVPPLERARSAAFREHVAFVRLDLRQPVAAGGNVRAYGSNDPRPRRRAAILSSSRSASRAVVSPSASSWRRVSVGSSKASKSALSMAPRADDPGRHPVDAGVEEVEPDVHAVEVVAADQLLGDRLELVGEDHHVVAVPANAPADVQQDLVQVHEHRRDLVRDDLGRMIVAGVQAQELVAREGIAEVKLVRADDVALRAEAEQLALDGVADVPGVERLGEDRVQRFGEPLARSLAVDRGCPWSRRESRRWSRREFPGPCRSPRRCGGRRSRGRSRTGGSP